MRFNIKPWHMYMSPCMATMMIKWQPGTSKRQFLESALKSASTQSGVTCTMYWTSMDMTVYLRTKTLQVCGYRGSTRYIIHCTRGYTCNLPPRLTWDHNPLSLPSIPPSTSPNSQWCRVGFAQPILQMHTLIWPILTWKTLKNMHLRTQFWPNAHPEVSFLAKPKPTAHPYHSNLHIVSDFTYYFLPMD
jgi:hypothetical protein